MDTAPTLSTLETAFELFRMSILAPEFEDHNWLLLAGLETIQEGPLRFDPETGSYFEQSDKPHVDRPSILARPEVAAAFVDSLAQLVETYVGEGWIVPGDAIDLADWRARVSAYRTAIGSNDPLVIWQYAILPLVTGDARTGDTWSSHTPDAAMALSLVWQARWAQANVSAVDRQLARLDTWITDTRQRFADAFATAASWLVPLAIGAGLLFAAWLWKGRR